MFNRSKWFPSNIDFEASDLILFCLPFCGGASSIYFSWKKEFMPSISICPVILPGREVRIREPFYFSLPALVADLKCEILPLLQKPFAIFGHSLGALIGFELIRALQIEAKIPQLFFASAHRPPAQPLFSPPLHSLAEIEFEERIKEYGGTHQAIFADPELKKLYLNVLRADFTLWETYQYSSQPSIKCPIIVFASEDDPTVSTEDLNLWHKETSHSLHIHMLKGGHFFLKDSAPELIKLIKMEIESKAILDNDCG